MGDSSKVPPLELSDSHLLLNQNLEPVLHLDQAWVSNSSETEWTPPTWLLCTASMDNQENGISFNTSSKTILQLLKVKLLRLLPPSSQLLPTGSKKLVSVTGPSSANKENRFLGNQFSHGEL